MAMPDDDGLERCVQHPCCIRAPRVEASQGSARLAGEWHLCWVPDDSAWFLVPPRGNIWEIRVRHGGDPVGELAVEGVRFGDVRDAIERRGLFPPC